jgi:hypothetical protein
MTFVFGILDPRRMLDTQVLLNQEIIRALFRPEAKDKLLADGAEVVEWTKIRRVASILEC